MSHIDMDQRPCAACHKTTYASTAAWCFVGTIQCLCSACADADYCFVEGQVVRQPSDLDVAIARANEEYLERLREASARRWAKPGAKEAMSRMRKAYWAERKQRKEVLIESTDSVRGLSRRA